MIADFIEGFIKQKAGDLINQQISKGAGGTDGAIHDVVGSILGGLDKNSKKSGGLDSLAGALDKDHDGSILDDIGDIAMTSKAGNGILKHVLGSQREKLEQFIASKTGLPQKTVGQLYEFIAPLVMAKLGKEKKSQGLDAKGIGDLLSQESDTITNDTELNPLLAMLDKDGDGDVDLHDFI